MTVSFSRTMGTLDARRDRTAVIRIGIASVVFGLWCWWFFGSEVPVYEVSHDARIEVVYDVHPVAATIGGRVVESHLELGRKVEQGEPLVVLSAARSAQRFTREKEREKGVEDHLASARFVRALTDHEIDFAGRGDQLRIRAARAALQAAITRKELAFAEAERIRSLFNEGLVSKADLDRSESLEVEAKATLLSQKATVSYLENEVSRDLNERRKTLAEIDGRISGLETEKRVTAASAAELAVEMEEHTIRAPTTGRIGFVSRFRPGTVLSAGDVVAVIVPDGDLWISARFSARSCLGRVHPGQFARFRLDAFPLWGSDRIGARVARVGESVDGWVRVECNILSWGNRPQDMRHGMPGRLMIEIERLSPFELAVTLVERRRIRYAGPIAGINHATTP